MSDGISGGLADEPCRRTGTIIVPPFDYRNSMRPSKRLPFFYKAVPQASSVADRLTPSRAPSVAICGAKTV